ncbi:MAG: Eco57I restriction-modification methylase domain-containing protein [Clostridia bacterium]|nr:Eco57I restriction-modification methylase domain-containing protein [Clostridia bacterium]
MAETFFDRVYKNRATHVPDVLSCLANLSNDEVFTPPEVVNQMLDMLPQELFSDPNTTFLDPACKTGVFLREIAKRLLEGLKDQIPDLQERIDHIFHKQLFGIGITELTSLLSRRSLYCSKYPNGQYSITHFDDAEGNIRFKRIEHTWGKTTYDKDGKPHTSCVFCGANKEQWGRSDDLETHAYEFVHVKPERIFNMKFDVIISNPPYQLSTSSDSAQAKPIYHLFVEKAKQLSPRYISMIIPSRWFSGGMGLDSFRTNMLSDKHISTLVDYQNALECFPGVEIKGGVCYFLWDKSYSGDAKIVSNINGKTSVALRPLLENNLDVFVRYNEAISILHKVQIKNEKSFADYINPQRFFGFPTKFKDFHEQMGPNEVKIYANKAVGFVKRSDVLMNKEAIDKHKVFVSEAYNGGDGWPHQIINRPFVGYPGDICTDTYMCIGPFSNAQIAENVCEYMKTKFFRFLVMLVKNTQHGAKKVYSLVPIQDFTKAWTDNELYKKYGLSQEETDFIESMIKPMDLSGGDE